MNFRLVVIENSLKDKTILYKYKVLSQTTFAQGDKNRESQMLKNVSDERW